MALIVKGSFCSFPHTSHVGRAQRRHRVCPFIVFWWPCSHTWLACTDLSQNEHSNIASLFLLSVCVLGTASPVLPLGAGTSASAPVAPSVVVGWLPVALRFWQSSQVQGLKRIFPEGARLFGPPSTPLVQFGPLQGGYRCSRQ